jgi:mRNA degradation ribonuclease J1/J2
MIIEERKEMKLEILGNGGAFSDATTSYLVRSTVLIDCSYQTIKQLIKDDKLRYINTVIFTHAHDDHIGGLSAFIEYKRYIQEDTRFTIYAGDYFMNHYLNLCVSKNYYGTIMDFTYKQILPDMKIDINGLNVEFIEVKHCNWQVPTFGLVLNGSEKSIFISADVDNDWIENLRPLIRKTVYSFIDMGWTDLPNIKEAVHPREMDIHNILTEEDDTKVIGIHCGELQHFRKAQAGEIYEF